MESKNTSSNINRQRHQRKGLQSEKAVIDQLQKKLWILEFHRAKTKTAEIDLIFQQDNKVLLIEVKTLDDPWRSFERISDRQVQKLIANQLYFASMLGSSFQISCYVAWVSKNKIDFVKIN